MLQEILTVEKEELEEKRLVTMYSYGLNKYFVTNKYTVS